MATGPQNKNGAGDVIVNGNIGSIGTRTRPSGYKKPVFIALVFLVVFFAMLFIGTLVLLIRERRLRKKMEATASDGMIEEPLVARARPIASSTPRMQEAMMDSNLRARPPSEERAQSPSSIGPASDFPPEYGT
ncbi:hypothetical protein B0H12DRAFT_444810 [Mycena haematopus]|nr:hypothetical protein B0H12DRAFT_444810 [Mycena haematopus]